MGTSAAAWHVRLTRTLLACCLLLVATMAQARPLPLTYQCTSAPLASQQFTSPSGWMSSMHGSFFLQPQFEACWIRLTRTALPGEHLIIKNGWADITVFSSDGREIAKGNRAGQRNSAMVSANYVIVPTSASWTAPLYLRVPTRMNGLPIANRVSVEAQDPNAALDAGRQQINISLAVAVAVLVIAFFSTAFSVVLRDSAYAWMGLYLLMSVVIRVFNSSEPLIFALSTDFDYARLVSRVMYPVINAVWILAYARLADFKLHTPRIYRLCHFAALLFLLQIPLWLIDGPPASASTSTSFCC